MSSKPVCGVCGSEVVGGRCFKCLLDSGKEITMTVAVKGAVDSEIRMTRKAGVEEPAVKVGKMWVVPGVGMGDEDRVVYTQGGRTGTLKELARTRKGVR